MSTPITDRGLVMLCLTSDGSPRCQKLRRLIVYETSITRFGAAIVLLSLPLLREFDFDRMFETLSEIGECCPNIVDLNLMSTPITDRGLVMLCLTSDGSPRCQKLRRLIVYETSITRFGAAIVLLSLPLLREFDFDRMFEAIGIVNAWSELEEHVLAALGVSASRQRLPPKESLLLTTFTSTAESASEQLTEVIANVCPQIESLSIDGTSLSSEDLYPFMEFQHLTSLSLTNYKSSRCYKGSLDFEDGVLPLLTAVGPQLKNLILSKFTSVDISGEIKFFMGLQISIPKNNFTLLWFIMQSIQNNIFWLGLHIICSTLKDLLIKLSYCTNLLV
ncbi:hypothetical protein J437_LFUL006989 [Ladona fulva]|uniref:Uncharacterized protein n=1 Tax=Ladona fulva TaxID=123851 RepID=A0A8K0K494_LADFU|nr:hypothetical protein J437_LFUL006989 [Ladona fulva]